MTEEESLAYEMSMGFEFMSGSGAQKIASSYSLVIAEDLINALDYDVTDSVTIPCKDMSAEGILGVGLW